MKNKAPKVNAATYIRTLWQESFFKKGRALKDVSSCIAERWGHNFSPANISVELGRNNSLRKIGKRGSYLYIQKISPVSKTIMDIEERLFSEELTNKMDGHFKTELKDLQLNFGNSGTCSAFLLRKILEKLIYLVFVQNNLESSIEDSARPGNLVGLEKMLDIAPQHKIKGLPILTNKTAQQIKGVKFLGDTSAHNPLINVNMRTIEPQMPFIITAYEELATGLK